jgi:hypothetical protein
VRLQTLVIVRITIWIFLASLVGTRNLASRLRNTDSGSPENRQVPWLLHKAEHDGLLVWPQNKHRAWTTWWPSEEELVMEAALSSQALWRFITKLSGSLVAPQSQE